MYAIFYDFYCFSISGYFYTTIQSTSFFGILGRNRFGISIAESLDISGINPVLDELPFNGFCPRLGELFIVFCVSDIVRVTGQAYFIAVGSHKSGNSFDFRQRGRQDMVFSRFKEEIIDSYRFVRTQYSNRLRTFVFG